MEFQRLLLILLDRLWNLFLRTALLWKLLVEFQLFLAYYFNIYFLQDYTLFYALLKFYLVHKVIYFLFLMVFHQNLFRNFLMLKAKFHKYFIVINNWKKRLKFQHFNSMILKYYLLHEPNLSTFSFFHFHYLFTTFYEWIQNLWFHFLINKMKEYGPISNFN